MPPRALTSENIGGVNIETERSTADTTSNKEEGAQGSAGRKGEVKEVSEVEKEVGIVRREGEENPGDKPTALQKVEPAHEEATDAAPSAPHNPTHGVSTTQSAHTSKNGARFEGASVRH